MERKVELLNHYIDYLYGLLKEYFPMVQNEINLKEEKERILSLNLNIHETKKEIEKLFDNKVVDYLNTKFKLVKKNTKFKSNAYEYFLYDYYLACNLLKQSDYIFQDVSIKYPRLVDDLSIEDCKDIVFDFYKELFYEDIMMIKEVKKIIYSRVEIIYDPMISYTDVNSKIIHLSYSNTLKFLISMAHEVAHLINIDLNYSKDVYDYRLIEVESSFVEKLFLDYLDRKKLKIIKGKDKNRSISKKDKELYFLNFYCTIFSYANRIFDEMNFIGSLNKGEFDINSYNEYKEKSHLFIDYYSNLYSINEVLDNYLSEEYRNLDMNSLEECKKNTEIYEYCEISSFNDLIKYLCSYILSGLFMDILNDEKIKKNFVEYLKKPTMYDTEDLLNLFILNIKDIFIIESKLTKKYAKLLNKRGYKFRFGPYFSTKEMKEDLDFYKKITNYIINNSWRGEFLNNLVKMSFLTKKENVIINSYPFNIEYQMEDNEVDEFIKCQTKVLELYNSNIDVFNK